jgi:hypothetical protein
MDEFDALFSQQDNTLDDLPIFFRPEIQSAIDRVVSIYGKKARYQVNMDNPVPTDNPYIQRINVTIFYEKGYIEQPISRTIWIDDFVMEFTVIDNPW